MKTETQKIITLLKRTFESGAWHGPSVREALKDLDSDSVEKRLLNTHSIIELVAHMIAWRNYVLNRMAGNNSFVVSDEINFPQRDDWSNVVKELEESQQKLIEAIETFPEYRLTELVPLSEQNYTYHTLLNGIIHHDVYHTGQIMLIKRAFGR